MKLVLLFAVAALLVAFVKGITREQQRRKCQSISPVGSIETYRRASVHRAHRLRSIKK